MPLPLGQDPTQEPRPRDPLERLRRRRGTQAPAESALDRLRQRRQLRAAPIVVTAPAPGSGFAPSIEGEEPDTSEVSNQPPPRLSIDRVAADVTFARPSPVRPPVHVPPKPTEEVHVQPVTSPDVHAEWARVARSLAEQGHEPSRALQYPSMRAKARDVPEIVSIFGRFHAKPGVTPTVPLKDALRTAALEHIKPGVSAVREGNFAERTLEAAGEQVVEKYRDKSAAPGAPSAMPRAERAAARQAEQVRTYGEARGRTPEQIAADTEQDVVDIGADEAKWANQLGTMLGDFVDPALLASGVVAEKVAMSALQKAAVRGVPLARRLLRLSNTPAGAGLLRRLLARGAHGLATGGAINVAAQTTLAAEQGRLPSLPELGVAGAIGTVAGPLFEAPGALIPAGGARARAAAAEPLTEQAANLLRAARLETDPARVAALEAEAQALHARAQGTPRVPRAAPVPEPRAPERRTAPRGTALDRLRRRVAAVISPEQEAAAQASVTDELTGAANVRGDRLATEQAHTERAEGDRIVRFRVDMDNFKALNDTHGHAAGDQALQAVTEALEAAGRPEDLVTLSRVGGDEFAITIRATEGADLAAIRDRFEQAADERLAAEGLDMAGERRVGTSIGFAEPSPEMYNLSPEEFGPALDALADQAARARKAERAVSQPRQEAAAAVPTLPEVSLPPAIEREVAAAEQVAAMAGPDAGRAEITRLRRGIDEARRRGEIDARQADDYVDAIEGRLAGVPAPEAVPEPVGAVAHATEYATPPGAEGAEPPPRPARLEPTPGAAANRETQPFESLQLEKPLGQHTAPELEALEQQVQQRRVEAQADLDRGAIGSTRPFDYDLQVLRDEQGRRAMADALHAPAPERLPEAPAPKAVLAGQRVEGMDGHEATVKNADGSAVRVRYRAVEAAELVTSHDPETFAHRQGYPEGIQERRYHADKVAQEEVARVAQQLDPDIVLDQTTRPTEGPGISTADGTMLSGNQRTMAIQRAYRAGSERAKAYRLALTKRAKEFGLSPEEVKSMREPILTREVIDETLDVTDRAQLAELVARFNDVATKAKDPLADAATRARRLRDAEPVLEHFSRTLEPDQTLREYLGTPAGRGFVEQLVDAHVIPRAEAARYIDRFGAVTDEGKGVIERTLYAAAIGDPEVAARAPRPLMRRLEHAIPSIVKVSRLSGWDLGPVLREALDLHAEIGAKGSKSLAELLDQGALFGRHDTPEAITLADFLERVTTKSDVTEAFRGYADAGAEATGQRESVDMFGYEPPSPVAEFRRRFANGKSPRVAALEVKYQTARAEQHATIAWKGGPAEVTRRAADLWERVGEMATATDGQLELEFTPSPATRRQMVAQARQPRVWVDVRGQLLQGPTDYHRFLHPFRDPGLERMHVLILDDSGRILSHTMETSGAINYVQTKDDFAWRIAARTKRVKGSQVVISHNHPSGNPTPSAEDIHFQAAVAASLEKRGVKLAGQYVIDDTEGVFIEHQGDRYEMHHVDLEGPQVRARRQLGEVGLAPRADWTAGHFPLVNQAYYAHRTLISMREAGALGGVPDAERFDVLFLNSQSRAVAIEPHHVSALETLETWLPQHMRANGARDVIIGVMDADKHTPAYYEVIKALRDPEAIERTQYIVRRRGAENVQDVINIANSHAASEHGELPPERRGYGGLGTEQGYRRARRVFEEPEQRQAADRGELSPYTPLEPGWRSVRESTLQEDMFGKPKLLEPEQRELLPEAAGRATPKLKTTKITAEEMARVRREGGEPAGERPGDLGLRETGRPYDPATGGTEEHGVPQRPGNPAVDAPSRAKIVRDLAEQLEVPIREGKMRQRRALGIYKITPEVIRVRVANDIETIAHEVGHHLQTLLFGEQAYRKRGGLSSMVLKPWRDELKPLGVGVSDQSSAEGLAEFVRRYLTNPEAARRRAPRFLDFMETTLREKFPDVLDLLHAKRAEYALWLEATPRSRLRAHVSIEESPDHASIRDKWTRFRTDVIDDMAIIERAVKDLTEGAGPKSIMTDATQLARLTRGSEGLANEFIEGKARDFATLKPVGKSLRDVFAPVKARLEDFRDYAVARRAQELHGRDIETGLIPADVNAVLGELESPLFQQTFDDLQTWNRHLLTYLRDAGVISPEAYAAVLENNKAYLPFYRVMDEQAKGAITYRSGRFGYLNSPLKRIKGSGREIIDPFESLVKNAQLYTHIAQRQQVSNALAKLAKLKGAGVWIEQVPAPFVKKAGVTAEQMLEMFDKRGVGPEFHDFLQQIGFVQKEGKVWVPTEQMAEEILQIWRPGDWMGEPNMISVLKDGKRVWYEVAPDLYDSLMGLRQEHVETWLRWASLPARTLRAGATLAPEFLGRNPFRDQIQAFITSDYGFKPGLDFARGFWHMMRKTETYGQWRAAGGDRSSLLGLDRTGLRRTFAKHVAREGIPNVVYNPLEMLRAISSSMEDATRIGEFARAVAKEGTGKEALLRAASASREITVDFARHGAKTMGLRHIAAFWNARLQGYDRLFRAFREHPVRTSARTFAGITLPSIALYYVNRDDPDYWELPQWQRDLFWCVKVGGTWLRIPKPFELGVVFGSIPERMLEWWDTQDPKAVSQTISNFLGTELQQTLLPMPTFLQPLWDNYGNYSAFRRRPLIPESLLKVAPEAQVTPYTSEVAEHLGRFMDYPPAKIDNLLNAWTGGLGRLGLDITTKGIRAIEGDQPTGAAPTSRRLVDLPGPYDIREQTPGVRGFVARAPGASSESVERFYQELAATSVAWNTAKFYERSEDDAALERWEGLHQPEIDRYEELRSTADDIAGIRAEINGVRKDPALSGDAKAEQIRDLEREIMSLAEEAIEFRTGARGRRGTAATRILGGVGDVLAGAGAGRVGAPR